MNFHILSLFSLYVTRGLAQYWPWCFQCSKDPLPSVSRVAKTSDTHALCPAPMPCTVNLHCRAELLSHPTMNIGLEETVNLPISASKQTILSWPLLCMQTTEIFCSPSEQAQQGRDLISPLSHSPR